MPKGIYKHKGHKQSEETKRKIGLANSIALRGRKLSEETKEKIRKAHIGRIHKPFSIEVKKKMSLSHLGEKSFLWKGGLARVKTAHRKVERILGKAKKYKCSCGKDAIEWSNKDHKYSDNLEDYTALCRSCHMKINIKLRSTKTECDLKQAEAWGNY